MTFDALYDELRAPVWKLCHRMLGDRHDADDAVQDTFLAVHRNLAGFRGEASHKTWVFRIAIHAALKLRATRRTRATDDVETIGSSPIAALEARDEGRRVAAAIAALPVEHGSVLSLSALDGVSHLEIAEILGVPPGTVGSRLHAARKKLMAALAQPA